MSKTQGVPIDQVFEREYAELEARSRDLPLQIGKIARDQLLGLALSGGGIRSATFNLGLLQALARARLLKEFDYLSTVSGGGYIGSWLSAWIKRSKSGVQEVEQALADGPEPAQLRFLREFSNYLTPRTGWFSTDTLTGVTTYSRNLLLNLTILVSFVAALLLLPWLLGGAAAAIAAGSLEQQGAGYLYLILGEVLLLIAAYGMAKSLACLDEYDRRTAHAAKSGSTPVLPATPPRWAEGTGLAVRVVLPLVASALALSMGAWAQPQVTPTAMWAAGLSFIALIFAFRWLCPRIVRREFPQVELPGKRDRWLRKSLALIAGSVFAGAVLVGLSRLLVTPYGKLDAAAIWHALVLGVPVALAVFLLAGTLVVGLSG
ncbi:MAG TPA: patatin-like phospholipase family protein, partial [Burkholderiales bacterium]|nr:patatin-like phospholipase family protein [Burkholderiales bacterium]